MFALCSVMFLCNTSSAVGFLVALVETIASAAAAPTPSGRRPSKPAVAGTDTAGGEWLRVATVSSVTLTGSAKSRRVLGVDDSSGMNAPIDRM